MYEQQAITRDKSGERKTLYPHFTCATDTNNIRRVFSDVKDTVLLKSLRDYGVIWISYQCWKAGEKQTPESLSGRRDEGGTRRSLDSSLCCLKWCRIFFPTLCKRHICTRHSTGAFLFYFQGNKPEVIQVCLGSSDFSSGSDKQLFVDFKKRRRSVIATGLIKKKNWSRRGDANNRGSAFNGVMTADEVMLQSDHSATHT